MELNAIQGGGGQPINFQRFLPQRAQVLPAQMLLQPTDKVGLTTSAGPSNPFAPDKRLSDLTSDQMAKLGGGSALETLARVQSNLTIGEAAPLLRNRTALTSIAGLMESRSDIRVSDFVSRDAKGKVRIDPIYTNEESMELLKERKDLQPGQLSSMQANFTKKFKNPRLGQEATKKAQNLMQKRPDLTPDDVEKLMDSMGQAVGMGGTQGQGQGQGSEMQGQAALDMFDSASKILTKRTDMNPDRLGELAGAVGQLGSPKDKQNPQQVSQGFSSAIEALEKNPLREPEHLTKLAGTIGEHFQGQDEQTARLRMGAFSKTAKMLGDNTNMEPENIDAMLRQAKQKNPKLSQGSPAQQARKLSGVIDGVTSGVSQGTVNPNNLASFFETPTAQGLGFPKPQQQNQPGRAGQQNQSQTPGTGQQAKKSGQDQGATVAQAPGQTGPTTFGAQGPRTV